MDYDTFERQVIEKMCEVDHPTNEAIKQQYFNAKKVRHEFTGAGVFTHLKIPRKYKCKKLNIYIGGVFAQFSNPDNLVMYLLCVRNGVIDFIEGFTTDDEWPTNYEDAVVYKGNDVHRKMFPDAPYPPEW